MVPILIVNIVIAYILIFIQKLSNRKVIVLEPVGTLKYIRQYKNSDSTI